MSSNWYSNWDQNRSAHLRSMWDFLFILFCQICLYLMLNRKCTCNESNNFKTLQKSRAKEKIREKSFFLVVIRQRIETTSPNTIFESYDMNYENNFFYQLLTICWMQQQLLDSNPLAHSEFFFVLNVNCIYYYLFFFVVIFFMVSLVHHTFMGNSGISSQAIAHWRSAIHWQFQNFVYRIAYILFEIKSARTHTHSHKLKKATIYQWL